MDAIPKERTILELSHWAAKTIPAVSSLAMHFYGSPLTFVF